jgi:endonuclease YncB( thermonuclease family)
MTVWTVPARVVRVIDGDTFVADLDLGWGLWRIGARVRLAGVDCPEMNTAEGVAARDFSQALMCREPMAVGGGTAVTVTSKSLDKYGRTLAVVRLASGADLATLLLDAGHARTA